MKNLLFVLGLISFGNVWGQAVLPFSKTAWGTAGTGVTLTSIGNRTTTSACSGNNAAIFDGTGDRISIQFDSDPDIVTFKLKKQSMSGASSILVEKSIDGITWTSIGVFGTAAGATAITDCNDISLSLGCGNRFVRWTYTKGTGNCDIDDVSITKHTGCSTNTITTGAVTGSPFAVDCLTTDSGSIAFTSSGTFNAGNIFIAQLSDAAGSFASPTNIGTLTSTANTGSINFTIPAGTTSGAGYLIRVVSSNPAATGTSSIAITVTLSGGPCVLITPYMTSVMINSCNQTCAEGHNEIVFGNTGDFSVLGNTSNIVLKYGSVPAPSATYTDGFTTVPATTTAINASAGCTVVQEGLGVTMPPNSSFVIVRSTICVDALDWTSLCGSGTIYIFYSTDATWQTSGNFVNSPSGLRYFQTQITATDASINTLDYSYNSDLLVNSDGEFVTYESSGGAPLLYGDDDCALQPILLPISLITFSGSLINDKSNLFWQTVSEQNNSHFTISHSTNGKQFKALGSVTGAGNSSELLEYRFVHSFPHPGMNYYKLQSTDYDGKTYEKGIAAIYAEFSFSFYDTQTATIELYYESDIEIYSTDGKLIHAISETKSIPFHQSGLFFILDKRSGITERLFVP